MRWAQDVDVLEEAGFTGTVRNMRKEMEQAEPIMMAKTIEESQAIQKEQEQQRNAWEQLPLVIGQNDLLRQESPERKLSGVSVSKRARPHGSEQREVPPKIFEALQLWV